MEPSFTHSCSCTVYGCCNGAGGRRGVSRRTYFRHKATQLFDDNAKPVEQETVAAAPVPAPFPHWFNNLPPPPVDEVVVEDDEIGGDIEGNEPVPALLSETFFDLWQEPLYEPDEYEHADDDAITVGEILLMFFEWMTAFKPSLAASKAMHKVLSTALAAGNKLPTWYKMQRMMSEMFDAGVVKVEMCPNDCIAFADMTHPKLAHYKHAHRQRCPKCNANRYLTRSNGKKVACKVGYYFPLDNAAASIFNKTDPTFVRNRDWDSSAYKFPSGHVRHSRGWHAKMTDNPHINKESRNQAWIGMHDGIKIALSSLSPSSYTHTNTHTHTHTTRRLPSLP